MTCRILNTCHKAVTVLMVKNEIVTMPLRDKDVTVNIKTKVNISHMNNFAFR